MQISGTKAKLRKVPGKQNFESLCKEEQSCEHEAADYVQ